MKLRNTYLADFINLLYPQLCQACTQTLLGAEDLLCTDCLYNLPFTGFQQQPDNIVARQFWGKLSLQAAYALLYFEKGSKVQHLMHQFKYQDRPAIGNRLGEIAGAQLQHHAVFAGVDVVVPVPLHPKRLRQRGYNQSAHFAAGLAATLHAQTEPNGLIRTVNTATQTRKSRFARFENMQEVFAVKNPERLANRHVLLVDDIITTGSTLEACGQALLQVPGLKLSIAAMAYAV